MGGFILVTEKSSLTCQNLELDENEVNYTGSIIASVNSSVAIIKHLHRYETFHDSFCPMVIQRSSHFSIVSFYKTNTSVETGHEGHRNETIMLVCADATDSVKGMVLSGIFSVYYSITVKELNEITVK